MPAQAGHKSGPPGWLLIVLAIAFVSVGTFAAFVLYAAVTDILSGEPIGTTSVSIPVISKPVQPDGTNGSQPNPVNPEATWNGHDRVTVLLLGIDQREGEPGPFRTDTMLLLSMDPVAKTATMLSIPRDLWVPMADYGYGKVTDRINTANFRGDLHKYPGGGPALTARTVELNLGLRVDYTVRINFVAFEKFIDMIGGIDVDVPEDINDPTYPNGSYGYDPFYIKAGHHHLDGPTALKYARTRHTPGSDFDRARRQQQVIMAVRGKVFQPGQFAGLLLKAPQLVSLFRNNMETTLSLEQIVALARLAAQIPSGNIRSGAIGGEQTTNWVTPNGEQVLIPQRESIARLIKSLFPPVGTVLATATPEPTATPESIEDEAAQVVVLNGGAPAGSAAQLTEYLQQKGYLLGQPGDALQQDYTNTLIIIHREKPTTVRSLARLLQVPASRIQMEADDSADADIEIIIGEDFELPGE